MKNRIYLVTGATGFLGGTICRQLLEKGKQVRAYVLPNDRAAQYIPEKVEVIEGDLCNLDAMERFFAVPEETETVVLHIASIVTVSPDYSQKVMDVNVGGTKNIIEMCIKHKECQKLVYCSSTGAIPALEKGLQIQEVDHFAIENVIGCYSKSKAMASQLVLDAVRERGLEACLVYPSGILGPGDFAIGETTKTVLDILNGKMPIGIDGSFNLCDVRDLAQGTIAAVDYGKTGNSYILANEEVTFKKFVDMLIAEAGCKKIKLFLPIRVAYVVAKCAEKIAKKRGEEPVMTTFSVYNLARNNRFDSQKAKKELGYMTRSYEETIRDEVAWLKKVGRV